VPNFSEGRSEETVRALAAAVRKVPGVALLDHTMDLDHHRSVLTFAGRPYAVAEAAFQAARVASELIDLRNHRGEHPRVGAVDVVPFVPIRGVGMQECIELARMVAQRIGNELKIPVFLYEQAASRPERISLESIRRGGLEGLADRMENDAAWIPDFGPRKLHPTAGAAVVGARLPLIAFNVNLMISDVAAAKDIAKVVRQSGGGLPFVKAIGINLASRGMVQVSMNLTNYEETPVHAALAAVQREAERRGIEVAGTEIVGLIPQSALLDAAQQALRLERFDAHQVLEARMEASESREAVGRFTVPEIAQEKMEPATKPAAVEGSIQEGHSLTGGSVGALAAAFAAALGVMVAKLTKVRSSEKRLAEIRTRLHELVQADRAAYAKVLQAVRVPPAQPDRDLQRAESLLGAAEVPLEIMKLACEIVPLLRGMLGRANPELHADLKMGLGLADAVIDGCWAMVEENMKEQPNQRLIYILKSRLAAAEQKLVDEKALCYTPASDQWSKKIIDILKLR
jgi:glutamate formiminotransferase/glutamate formiminotransferase/formiminotetrahydrofolate cyclodeaminase